MDCSTTSWVSFFVFVFTLISRSIDCEASDKVFSVVNFGAVGDSRVDDTQAFAKAWNAACNGAQPQGITPVFHVPVGKTFLVKKVTFQGPCKSRTIGFQLRGNIVAPKSPSEWSATDNWIIFRNVNGLTMNGAGTIDGRGSQWWTRGGPRPTVLAFSHCSDLVVDGFTSLNSPKAHMSVSGCERATFSNFHLIAPQTSPNTDGMDISNSRNIKIDHSHIATGDDCIAIGHGSAFINITAMNCGPGHGVSIGSLGGNGATHMVEEIHVKDSTFKGTQNGARIKTWQGGSGYARKITFDDITLIGSGQPIIIDQYYCPHATCRNETKAVQISDVSFTGFRGTSVSKEAIKLHCSQSVGCRNIYLNGVNIGPAGKADQTQASCTNAHGTIGGQVNPRVDCLLR